MSSRLTRVIVPGMDTNPRIPPSVNVAVPSALGHQPPPLHVAVILDGNGRWATARGLPRSAGHQQGIRSVRRIVRAAPPLGVGTLSLYAFSSDNWQRPASEVSFLMRVLDEFLRRETAQCVKRGVRISVIGRRDRLPPALVQQIELAEAATVHAGLLHVRLAIDYSGRDAIWYAAECAIRRGQDSREHFSWAVRSGRGEPAQVPDVDLLVRTGGERRLSDFLLWELAYAELYFSDTMWPDFQPEDLQQALVWFRGRDRRFGRITASA